MKFVLVIFLAFQFDEGVSSQQIHFDTQTQCETARQIFLRDLDASYKRVGMGRFAFTATCMEVK